MKIQNLTEASKVQVYIQEFQELSPSQVMLVSRIWRYKTEQGTHLLMQQKIKFSESSLRIHSERDRFLTKLYHQNLKGLFEGTKMVSS